MNALYQILLLWTLALVSFCHSAEEEVTVDGKRWMQAVSGDVRMNELSLIGTHDSCALHGGIYAECQSLSLKRQLEIGVRFLDIRCKLVKGELKIFHGIADQKMKFDEVRDICLAFLEENPSEVLLMSVKYEGGRAAKVGAFGAAFKKSLEHKGHVFSQKGAKQINGKWTLPALSEVRGKVVVISRNKEIAGISWSRFVKQDAFYLKGKGAVENKWKTFLTHVKRINQSSQPKSINFLSASGFLYPPGKNAEKLNRKLKVFLVELLKSKKPQFMGITVVDYVDAELCKLMISLNAKRL